MVMHTWTHIRVLSCSFIHYYDQNIRDIVLKPILVQHWPKRETTSNQPGAILWWSQDQINSLYTNSHQEIIFKIFNYFFINFLFIIKKILVYVCVTKHYLFGPMTILEILINQTLKTWWLFLAPHPLNHQRLKPSTFPISTYTYMNHHHQSTLKLRISVHSCVLSFIAC